MSRPTAGLRRAVPSRTLPRVRRIVLLALPLALAAAVLAAPAQGATRGCDLTGDAHRADDCITHAHVGATADGTMRRGDTITIRERIAEPLRGSPLVVVVQMRRVARDGTKGRWVGLRRTRWSAADTAAHAQRTVDVCGAVVAGRYEFRTETWVPQSALKGRMLRQASGQTATSAPTTVTMPNRSAGGCPNSPDDETIIEYFNEIEFSEDLYVVITDQGTSFSLTWSCPPQQSPYFPPADFAMIMALEGAPSGVGCNDGAIVLDKTTMASGGYDACQRFGRICTFDILLFNATTQAVYSDTIVMITFTNGDATYIPNLNPATIPMCPANFNPCLLTGQCSLSTTKTGALSLCDGADGFECAPPPTNSTYSYNENVFFQTAIKTAT